MKRDCKEWKQLATHYNSTGREKLRDNRFVVACVADSEGCSVMLTENLVHGERTCSVERIQPAMQGTTEQWAFTWLEKLTNQKDVVAMTRQKKTPNHSPLFL